MKSETRLDLVKRSKSVPFQPSDDGEGILCVDKESNQIKLVNSNSLDSENIFGNKLFPYGTGMSNPFRPELKSTVGKLAYADVQDTAENPIIVVYCDTISIFKNTPALIKFLYVGKNGVLAALIAGACAFDGVVLERCYYSEDEGNYGKAIKTFDGEALKGTVVSEDKKTGYDFLYDCVFEVHMLYKEDKSGALSFSSACSDKYFLDGGAGYEKARKEYEKSLNDEALRKEVQKAEYEAFQKEKSHRLAEEAEMERMKKESKKNSGIKSKEKVEVVNVGASGFLAAVKALKA
jgi:hypothetical protein